MASCCLIAKGASDKITKRIGQVKASHIAFLISYAIAFAVALVLIIQVTPEMATEMQTQMYGGLALTALILSFANLIVLIVALVFACILLCDINAAS